MATEDAGGETFTVYANIDTADVYMAGAIHGANWEAADVDTKGQGLVTATRILDRQKWQSAYDTFAEREVVQDIIDASIEMALSLIDGSTIQTAQNQAQLNQEIKAGSVMLKFFRGAEGTPLRFPTIVHELLRDYLAGGNVTVTGIATGTGGITSTDDDFGYNNPI